MQGLPCFFPLNPRNRHEWFYCSCVSLRGKRVTTFHMEHTKQNSKVLNKSLNLWAQNNASSSEAGKSNQGTQKANQSKIFCPVLKLNSWNRNLNISWKHRGILQGYLTPSWTFSPKVNRSKLWLITQVQRGNTTAETIFLLWKVDVVYC